MSANELRDGRAYRQRYGEVGSFARIEEAALAYIDVDTRADSDLVFHRARMRLLKAVKGYTRAAVGRLTRWQRKGGLARAAKLSESRRREIARNAIRARWAKRDTCKHVSED